MVQEVIASWWSVCSNNIVFCAKRAPQAAGSRRHSRFRHKLSHLPARSGLNRHVTCFRCVPQICRPTCQQCPRSVNLILEIGSNRRLGHLAPLACRQQAGAERQQYLPHASARSSASYATVLLLPSLRQYEKIGLRVHSARRALTPVGSRQRKSKARCARTNLRRHLRDAWLHGAKCFCHAQSFVQPAQRRLREHLALSIQCRIQKFRQRAPFNKRYVKRWRATCWKTPPTVLRSSGFPFALGALNVFIGGMRPNILMGAGLKALHNLSTAQCGRNLNKSIS